MQLEDEPCRGYRDPETHLSWVCTLHQILLVRCSGCGERSGGYTVVVGVIDVKRVFGRLYVHGMITKQAMYV